MIYDSANDREVTITLDKSSPKEIHFMKSHEKNFQPD